MSEIRLLRGRVVETREIPLDTRESMFSLMDRHYIANRKVFLNDLSEKDWAILLEDEGGTLQGFTSLKEIRMAVGGAWFRALYSGDTIIEKRYWGSLELPKVWGRFMLTRIEAEPEIPLYWFLISSGYKTYRFLPVFFKEFYPRFDAPIPAGFNTIRNELGGRLFGDRYDPETGIIRLAHPTPLREGVADVPDERRLDPHINFFLRSNPDWSDGAELACIAHLHIDNLQPFIRRVLRV